MIALKDITIEQEKEREREKYNSNGGVKVKIETSDDELMGRVYKVIGQLYYPTHIKSVEAYELILFSM